jgi:Flp pilus assembly protein TadG
MLRNCSEMRQEDESHGRAAAFSRRRGLRGQAFVEFALTLPLAGLVLFGTIQLALLGNVYLALNQAAYAGARYAAVNPSASQAAIGSYVKSVSSPTLLSNNGGDLNVVVTPNATLPRNIGSTVTVTLTYNTASKLFFRGISVPHWTMALQLPSSLSSSDSSYSE